MNKRDTRIQILQKIEQLVVLESVYVESDNKVYVPLNIIRDYLEEYFKIINKVKEQ